MRILLQRLSRGIVLERKLPKRFGAAPIYVSPDASLRYWKPTLENIDPALHQSIEELIGPGDVVWDVGANVGLFSFAAAFLSGRGGRVIAIEPDIFLSGLLHRSASRLPLPYAQVDVLPLAISDAPDLLRLNIAGGGRASNSLSRGNLQIGGVRATQSVLCVTLDWLLDVLPPPDVLKIDVEQLETAALRGATRMLSKIRPRIHCEMSDNKPFEILKAANYKMFDAEKPSSERSELRKYAFNTIAIPNR